ncbi:TPA: hypothetical protein ACYUYS_005374 [Klebsiella pneumoniae]
MKNERKKITETVEFKSLFLLIMTAILILSIYIMYGLNMKNINNFIKDQDNLTSKEKIEIERREKEYMELLSLKLKVCDKEKELGYSNSSIFDNESPCLRYKIKYDQLKQKYNKTTER